MKITRNRILGTTALLVFTTIIATVSWWGWRRYLSPHIEPSEELYPIRGLDLSAHNGDIDFNAVREAGMQFVMLKATEGISFTDRKFADNYRLAREAGLKVGAYHFFRFDCNGAVQANHFLNVIKGLEFDFPVTLDVEESGNPEVHGTGSIVIALEQAIRHLELNGYDVMLYTNKRGYRRFISSFPDYPLWICSFSDPPGPDTWYMWQYTHRGRVNGVDDLVDINILNTLLTAPCP